MERRAKGRSKAQTVTLFKLPPGANLTQQLKPSKTWIKCLRRMLLKRPIQNSAFLKCIYIP